MNMPETVTALPEQVPQHLCYLSSKCDALAEKIVAQLPRSNWSDVASNLCIYIGGELKEMSRLYPDSVRGLAWCTRNLFEVNLVVRYVLASEDNLRTWLGQILQDEREWIEGALSFAGSGNDDLRQKCQHRLTELKRLALKHKLDFSKPFRVPALAKDTGTQEEYDALYKLLSKYVHPSSLWINAWHSQTPDLDWLNVFIARAQVYAGDSISRLAAACELQA
jgi:hypothetical protein